MSELDTNKQEQRPSVGRRLPSTRSILGLTFGIFMILLYVGMGVLFLIDFFHWSDYGWGWMRWILGPVLIVYGFYRGWRQYKMFTSPDDQE